MYVIIIVIVIVIVIFIVIVVIVVILVILVIVVIVVIVVILFILVIVVIVVIVDFKIKSDKLTEWQGHLFGCPVQLKKVSLSIVWLQVEPNNRSLSVALQYECNE